VCVFDVVISQFCSSVILLGGTVYYVFVAGKGLDGCAGMKPLAANLAFNMTLLFNFVGVAKTNNKGGKGEKKE
jgi:hypothetical protein